MMSNAIITLTKVVAFLVAVVCSITAFYAVVHVININSQVNVFFSGLLAMLIGVVAGPLFCLIGGYGLIHYVNITPAGAWLICLPILAAWCLFAFTVGRGILRG